MATLEDWRRVQGRRGMSLRAPSWSAPVAAAVVVLVAVAAWSQHRPAPGTPDRGAASAAVADDDGAAPPTTALRQGEPGGTLVHDGARYAVGEPSDVVVEGDWSCDGRSALALLRPSTGDVYRFDGWAAADADLAAVPVRRVAGARTLEAGDTDGDGCDDLVVLSDDGGTTPVPLR